jgi:electron transport complex protein RnfB
MPMPQFLIPILTLTGLGLFFGLVLTYASKKFAVVQDPRIKEVLENLPGGNCGVCGTAGCARFAEAVIKGETSLQNCRACSEEQASAIARILGVKPSLKEKKVARLRCQGGKLAKDKFMYQGLEDCQAAVQLLGGQKSCSYACLGFGTCEKACPFGAIKMGPEGLPIIDNTRCTGCGKCIQACPRNLLILMPPKTKVYIGCNSHDPGKIVTQVCAVGCIACKKCVQVCPEEAIKIVENLAVIDYDKCTLCGKCIQACPRKIIKEKI